MASYANENQDLPSTFFVAKDGYDPRDPPQVVDLPQGRVWGYWFDQSYNYYLALSTYLARDVMKSPGWRSQPRTKGPDGDLSTFPDFHLAECLYATPEFWVDTPDRGPSQWRAQRLTAVETPSVKGFVWEFLVYGQAAGLSAAFTQVTPRAQAAVAWFDGSTSSHDLTKLRPGVENPFDHWNPWRPGPPYTIARTRLGVRGRDIDSR